MRPLRIDLVLALAIGMLALMLGGCSATSQYMVRAKTHAIDRSPDMATVVFIRPSNYASAQLTTVLDSKGRFLGDALPQSYFAVKVPPGEHVFIAWAENTSALRANLAAGKIYFVEVSSKLGWMSARMHLLALGPNSDNWKHVDEWLGECNAFVPDEPQGQGYLRKRAVDTGERIDRGLDALKKYDAAELAERTLVPTDGR